MQINYCIFFKPIKFFIMNQECVKCGKKLNSIEISYDSYKGKCTECYDNQFSTEKMP